MRVATYDKKKRTIAVVLTVLCILCVSSVVAYSIYRQHEEDREFKNPHTDNIVKDTNQPLTDGKKPSEDKTITPSQPTATEEPSHGTPEKPLITRATQTSDGSLRVSAMFSNTSSGECTIRLQKHGVSSIEKSAKIIVGPSYYTCDGFLISRSDIPVAGVWTVSIIHKEGSTSAESEAIELDIK